MRRFSIDIGGINTDSVLIADYAVLYAVKTRTTGDDTFGILTRPCAIDVPPRGSTRTG
jgi:N-methylhydantoinase A/oxoprolinase/acetone carboxylase beta subunit